MVVGKPLLRTIPLLSSLSDSQLDTILMCSRTVAHGGNVVLFQEGDPGDYLFLVVSGRVKVSLLGGEGKEIVLSILGPRSFLGEMALLDGSPRSATAMTLERSTLIRWSRREFLALVLGDETLLVKILAHLVGCLRQANDQLRTMVMFDIHGRVVRTLLRLAREQGSREHARIVIDPRPSQRLLAQMIGCQRETVSRAMKALQSARYITVTQRSLAIEERGLRRYWTPE